MGPQAERMEQTLLANQFVAGLRPVLKRKLIGVDEELILKARFEEAKGRELAEEPDKAPTTKEQGSKPKYSPRKAPVTEATQPSTPPAITKQDAPNTSIGMSKGI